MKGTKQEKEFTQELSEVIKQFLIAEKAAFTAQVERLKSMDLLVKFLEKWKHGEEARRRLSESTRR